MTDNKPRYEKRKHARLKKNLTAAVVFRFSEKDNQESLAQAASILNISPGGVCLEIEGFNEAWKDDLLFGRIIIALKIEFPGTENQISVLARAVWITKTVGEKQAEGNTVKHVLGARFIEINSKEEEAIIHYIIKHFFKNLS